MKKIVLCAVAGALVFVGGCATQGALDISPDSSTLDQSMREEIAKVRTLKVLVVTEEREDFAKVRSALERVSRLLRNQLGVELSVLDNPEMIAWKDRSRCAVVRDVHAKTLSRAREFDVAVGYVRQSVGGFVGCLLGCWVAVTDDTYRRFIVARDLHPWFIAHEFGHTLILDHGHSDVGLMRAVAPQLLPGLPPLIGDDDHLLSNEDLREALKNKWRNFGERVVVPDPEDEVRDSCD